MALRLGGLWWCVRDPTPTSIFGKNALTNRMTLSFPCHLALHSAPPGFFKVLKTIAHRLSSYFLLEMFKPSKVCLKILKVYLFAPQSEFPCPLPLAFCLSPSSNPGQKPGKRNFKSVAPLAKFALQVNWPVTAACLSHKRHAIGQASLDSTEGRWAGAIPVFLHPVQKSKATQQQQHALGSKHRTLPSL